MPDIDWAVSLHKDTVGNQMVTGLMVALPIPILNYNQGGIQQAFAQLAEAEQGAQHIGLQLRQQFAQVFQRYANARSRVHQYTKPQDGILAKTKESLRLTTIGYEAGEFTSLEMLTVQRTFTDANLAYLQALRQLWASLTEIEGLLLKDSLQERL
jgi:cobalt-zinc-cadmium efflux system outer membrane protein